MPIFRTVICHGLLLLLLLPPLVLAAPSAKLWERWAAHDPDSRQTIDHGAWHGLLGTYVKPNADGINRFAYAAIGEAERRQLDAYLAQLAAVPISRFNRDQQRAYWINLYNALTVAKVVESWPVDSIRDIRSGLFSAGPWRLKLVEVEGEQLTLDDIEHRILRPIWRDPRIHYAVNCAALGCPNLQGVAFTAANSDRLLDRGARQFVNHPRGARVDDGRLLVSSIYDWFEADFAGNDAGVIAHLRQFADAELADALNGVDRVSGDAYDWSINVHPPR